MELRNFVAVDEQAPKTRSIPSIQIGRDTSGLLDKLGEQYRT